MPLRTHKSAIRGISSAVFLLSLVQFNPVALAATPASSLVAYPAIHNDARVRFSHSTDLPTGTIVLSDGLNATNYDSDIVPFPSFAYSAAGSYVPDRTSLTPGLTRLFESKNLVNPFAAAETSARGLGSQLVNGQGSIFTIAASTAEARYSFIIEGPDNGPVPIIANIFLFAGITYDPTAPAGTTSASAFFRLRDEVSTAMQSRLDCSNLLCPDNGGIPTVLTSTLLANHEYEVDLVASATSLNFSTNSQRFSSVFFEDTSATSYADPYFAIDPSFDRRGEYTFRFSEQANNISPVPEPSSTSLIALGLLVIMLGTLRRQKRTRVASTRRVFG